MIANVSPGAASFEDTYNTLKYANRAKNIKTNPNKNVTNVQHHISNYTNIINNLKNEVSELKSQLLKKDKDYLSIKNENFGINNETHSYFERCVIELVTICEKEYSCKKQILIKEQDLNEILANQSQINICKSNEIDLENNELKIQNEEKIESLKNQIESLKDKKEKYEKRREKMATHWYKKGIKDFYLDYLHNIQRNHLSKVIILEGQVKDKVSHIKLVNKDALIKELEQQIKLRDEVLKRNNIISEEQEPLILPLERIQSDYEALPNIVPKIDESFHIHLINNSINNLNLPPINISNVISEGNLNNHNKPFLNINVKESTGNTENLRTGKSKTKLESCFAKEKESLNIGTDSVSAVNQEKNISNPNILNLNCIQKCKDNIKNLLDNKSPNLNFRRHFSPNSRKNSHIPPNYQNKKNSVSKGSISKLASEKHLKEHRDFSNIKIVAKKKESNQIKDNNCSDLSIETHEQNTSFDREDCLDSRRKHRVIPINKMHNNVVKEKDKDKDRERRLNQNQSNLSIGEQNNPSNITPVVQNGNPTYFKNINDRVEKESKENTRIEKDNFFNNKGAEVPFLKKKDLNVYLYDKQKFRNNSKKPFR